MLLRLFLLPLGCNKVFDFAYVVSVAVRIKSSIMFFFRVPGCLGLRL